MENIVNDRYNHLVDSWVSSICDFSLNATDEILNMLSDTHEIDLHIIKTLIQKKKENKNVEKWLELMLKMVLKFIATKESTINNLKMLSTITYGISDYFLKNLKKNESEEGEEKDEGEEKEDNDLYLDNELSNVINNFKWRTHQEDAIQNVKKQNFSTGIIFHIMGAGKTYVMLKILNEHIMSKKNKGKLYIIACDKQEILRKTFYDKDKKWNVNEMNKWKEYGIIDLFQFNKIDCVYQKLKYINLSENKPNLLIINNDYLKSLDKNGKIPYSKTNLMLLDECHCVSANYFYKLLRKIKYEKKINIIGFSATPLRYKSENKLCDIFSLTTKQNKINKKVNIISSYDLMKAIMDDIVLPFKCHYVEIEKNSNKKKIGKTNREITEQMFKEITKTLPYNKIIIWTRTTNIMKEYYDFFNAKYGQRYNVYCSSFKDKELSKTCDIDFNEFCKRKKRAILICVNRCREGSDIENLDCGMFLDGVKQRSTLVSMQTGGRIMRPDKAGLKKRAVIVDTFVSDNTNKVEMFTVQKVINYYLQLYNLTEEDENIEDYYKHVVDIVNRTFIDVENSTITIKIDDNQNHDIFIKLKLLNKKIDWDCVKQLLIKEIDAKFKISKDDKFKMIIQKLKDMKIFTINSYFWKEYDEIENKKDKGLPENIYDEYKEYFVKNNWFELLHLDTSIFYNLKELRHKMWKYGNEINEKNMKIIAKDDVRIPNDWYEFYRILLNFKLIINH